MCFVEMLPFMRQCGTWVCHFVTIHPQIRDAENAMQHYNSRQTLLLLNTFTIHVVDENRIVALSNRNSKTSYTDSENGFFLFIARDLWSLPHK